jgi:hypothetical protein
MAQNNAGFLTHSRKICKTNREQEITHITRDSSIILNISITPFKCQSEDWPLSRYKTWKRTSEKCLGEMQKGCSKEAIMQMKEDCFMTPYALFK